MEQLRCTYCGGLLQDRGDHYVCESCRTKIKKSAMEQLSDQDIFDLNAARRLKETFRFDEAQAAYDEVLRRNPACEEAAWGAFLSEYGIEYQIEEQKPTFHALSEVPVYKSRYYDKLSPEHRHEADEVIEFKRQEVMRGVEKLDAYDVFLSLKIDGEDGTKTPEYEWAMQLYYDLREMGYKVFFSPQVLKTTNADWEPYIYRAIQTCRIMLVLTSSIENTNAPWVRNEWRRILSRIKNTPRGEQPPVYRVIATDMNCVPAALRGKQVLLHGDYHLRELIESAVKEACATPEDTESATGGLIQVPQSLRNIKNIPLLKELLRDAGFTNVREFPLHDMDGADGYPWIDGALASIMVAGEDYNFDGNASYFDPATPVLITYHCLSEVAEAKRKEREGAERRAREEAERRAREEAERRAREEAERRAREEAERRAREGTERTARKKAQNQTKPQKPSTDFPFDASLFDVDFKLTDSTEPKTQEQTKPQASLPKTQEQAKPQASFAYDSNGLVSLKDRDTAGHVYIPSGAKGIAPYGFENCTKITSVTIPDSVTKIGAFAFCGCLNLTNITIPSSVTKIGSWAFQDCVSLTSITIPNSVIEIGQNAFKSCTGLTSITIPESVTKIGNEAFANCKKLEITIPDTVTKRGKNILFGTKTEQPERQAKLRNLFTYDANGYVSLKDRETVGRVYIPDGVTGVAEIGFKECKRITEVIIPKGMTKIGDQAFDGCSGLTSITIPNSVTSIGEYAFSGCESLTSITIPDSVTSIGEYAFSGCESLTSITIPDSVTSIGKFAFSACTGLTSISIPNSVATMGENPFSDCPKLRVTVAPANRHFRMAGNCLISKDGTLISGFDNSVIPADGSVTKIGYCAFNFCTGLTSITIPNSVTSIDRSAFNGCTGLTSIRIPNSVATMEKNPFCNCPKLRVTVAPANRHFRMAGNCLISRDGTLISGFDNSVIPADGSVTRIGAFAFDGCKGLTSITIPSSVTKINSAFFGCTGLTSITIPSSVTYISLFAFCGCTGLTSVTFTGTKSQWTAIKEKNLGVDFSGSFTVHGTNGDIPNSDA